MATETHPNIQLQYVGVGNGELEGLDKTEAYMLHFLAIVHKSCLFIFKRKQNWDFYMKYPNVSTLASLFIKSYKAQLNSLWAVFRPVCTGWRTLV